MMKTKPCNMISLTAIIHKPNFQLSFNIQKTGVYTACRITKAIISVKTGGEIVK